MPISNAARSIQSICIRSNGVHVPKKPLIALAQKGFGGFSATLSLEPASRSLALEGLSGLKREPERFVNKEL
jgi:hypothetical protein